MTTAKGWVILALLVLATILFVIVGFDIFTWDGNNLAALGLAAFVAAEIVHLYFGTGSKA